MGDRKFQNVTKCDIQSDTMSHWSNRAWALGTDSAARSPWLQGRYRTNTAPIIKAIEIIQLEWISLPLTS